MEKKSLYIGNIPWSTTKEQLLEAFSLHGKVDNPRIVIDKATGRSKGFAFIDVATEDYENVIQSMNGKDFGGRQLKVNEAAPRKEKQLV